MCLNALCCADLRLGFLIWVKVPCNQLCGWWVCKSYYISCRKLRACQLQNSQLACAPVWVRFQYYSDIFFTSITPARIILACLFNKQQSEYQTEIRGALHQILIPQFTPRCVLRKLQTGMRDGKIKIQKPVEITIVTRSIILLILFLRMRRDGVA